MGIELKGRCEARVEKDNEDDNGGAGDPDADVRDGGADEEEEEEEEEEPADQARSGGRKKPTDPWGSGQIVVPDVVGNGRLRCVSAAGRFFRMNIARRQDGREAAAVLSCKALGCIAWVHGNVPHPAPMRFMNPTTMTFISHFHRHGTDFTRVPLRDDEKERFKVALFNVVHLRTSGKPVIAFLFAKFMSMDEDSF